MIPKFKDYKKLEISDSTALEAGGYELKIINAKVEEYSSCSILKVAFDIINNSKYTDFYAKRFKTAKSRKSDAKWSGVFDVFIPKDDGSDMDYYTKINFKRFITAVEESNQNFKWNWDEASLKGKVFGGVFGREEFETSDGKRKFAVKCRFARNIESIRNGDFVLPEDKLLDIKSETQNLDYGEIISDQDVPF